MKIQLQHTVLLLSLLIISQFILIGCNPQGRGFALPQGDIDSGKAAFTKFRCNSCHQIAGIEHLGNEEDLKIVLGGKVSRVKSYGELVTSVINPSHKISKAYREEGTAEDGSSKMEFYNEVMTVQELVDLVTFLQSEYHIVPPETIYTPYY